MTIPVRNNHGTFISLIILCICEDVEFISFNVLDEQLKTDARVLLSATSQVFDYEPDIIHMSLGTEKKRYWLDFKKILWEAKKKNVFLVSAASNSGSASYPAYMHGVFGVKADKRLVGSEYYYQKGFFYAPVGVEHIPDVQKIPDYQMACGSSMSAAYITGHLAKYLYNLSENSKWNYNEAKKILIRNIMLKGR